MKLSKGGRQAFLLCAAIFALSVTVIADDGMRKWRDRSGKFEVEAKLLSRTDGEVRLLKKDGRAVTVPVTALSDEDQNYLKDLADTTPNPFAGGAPVQGPGGASDLSSAGLELLASGYVAKVLPTDGQPILIDLDEPSPPLTPDPPHAAAQFRKFTRPMEKLDAYAGCSSPILVDPKGPTFAVSVHRAGVSSDPTKFGRIYLIRESEKRPQPVLDIEETLLLFDHHPPSGRSLAVIGVNRPSDRGGDIVLLDNLAMGKPTAVARWRVPEWDRPGFKPKVEFARLLDGDRAVIQINNTVYLWGLESGTALFKIESVPASAKIEVSGGGKYLAIPTTGGCGLIDIAKGEFLGRAPFPSRLTPQVRFSPNGQRLALVAGNQFVVWDLTKASVSAEATIGNPCGAFFGWVGDQYLLTQLGGLIDPQLGATLWFYHLPSNNQALTMPGGVAAVDKSRITTLICLPVPHGPVQSVAKRLGGDDSELMLIRPGTELALKIDAIAGVDETVMREGLKTAVERAGWKVSQQSPIQIVAKIDRGKKQKLYFRTIGRSFLEPPETVSIEPFTASLEVRYNNDVLWSRSSTNMVPSFLRLKRGEKLKQAVKKYEKADPSYFQRLTLPPKILRPEISKIVGRSQIRDGAWQDYFPKR